MTNDEIVYKVGIDNGLPGPVATLLAAQARLESGQYKSQVFLKNNNAFGYKWVGQFGASKGTVAPQSEWQNPSTPGYYAAYNNLDESALEVVKWIKRRINQKTFKMEDLYTPDGYANAFKKGGYFGEAAYEYSQDLASIANKYFTKAIAYVKNNPGTVGLFVFVIILAIAKKQDII